MLCSNCVFNIFVLLNSLLNKPGEQVGAAKSSFCPESQSYQHQNVLVGIQKQISCSWSRSGATQEFLGLMRRSERRVRIRISCFLSQGRSQLYWPSLRFHQPHYEATPERTQRKSGELRRHPFSLLPTLPSPRRPPPRLLSFSLALSFAATHVSDQVQPASSVSKLQAPGKPTESTFIAGDPVTECVIHYSLICTPAPTHPPTRHPPIQPRVKLSLITSTVSRPAGVSANMLKLIK